MKNFIGSFGVLATLIAPPIVEGHEPQLELGIESDEEVASYGSRETRAESGIYLERGENTGSRETRAENGSNSRSDPFKVLEEDLEIVD